MNLANVSYLTVMQLRSVLVILPFCIGDSAYDYPGNHHGSSVRLLSTQRCHRAVANVASDSRVVALYKSSKLVQFIVGGYLLAELCVGLWIYSVPGGHRMFSFLIQRSFLMSVLPALALPPMVHGDAFTRMITAIFVRENFTDC